MANNTVVLEGWYAQPIHCPFCGASLMPDDGESCKHLLYVISGGDFVARSHRFDRLLGLEPGEGACWPFFSQEEKKRLGKPFDVADRVRGELVASLEYQINNPGDTTCVGYAALDEELCGWGVDHQSPYNRAESGQC